MRYTLFKQKYGSPTSFGEADVTDELPIVFDYEGLKGTLTAKIVSGGEVYYDKIIDGVATFPRAALKGKMSLSVVTENGVIPCVGLVAVDVGNRTVVHPDPAETFDRLYRCEKDISNTIDAQQVLEGKYNAIMERLDKLFLGYNM